MMKRKIGYAVGLMMSWGSGLFLSAQEAVDSLRLPVEHVRFQRQDDSLSIAFQYQLDSIGISSNRAIRLEPVLCREAHTVLLPPLTVAGRRQVIMHQREKRAGEVVKRINGKKQVYPYTCKVKFEEWMNGAQLYVMLDLCGCGGHPLAHQQVGAYEVWVDVPVYEVQPVLAFVMPKVEGTKHRAESGRAFLDFPVNEVTIYPHYRQNPVELEKICHTVDVIRNDSNTQITQVSIHGYASPEGSWANNQRLAQGRAMALKKYVGELYQFADSLFTVQATPEDWEGLKLWLVQSAWEEKDELLQLMATITDADARNAALQQWRGGKVYSKLLKEVYPALRHSDYTVHYTVRSFDVEEAKRLLKTRPQWLSLAEMYGVAATYASGSEAFNEVFDIAVRMFPEDEVANLNAALIALSEKNYMRAERYLEKAGNSPEAVHARGVWCLMTERYEAAKTYLQEAAQLGVTQALENLRQWELKQDNLKKQSTLSEL